MDKQKERDYDSVKALILGIHAPVKNVSRPSTPIKSVSSPSSPTEHSSHVGKKPISLNLVSDKRDSPINSLLLSPKRHSLQVHHSDNALRIPTLLITGPGSPSHTLDNHHRRFSFGLRRHSHSHTGLNRVESMGTLGHRALLQFLDVGDIQGLKNYLENRSLQVDDRDDNGTTLLMVASGRGTVPFVKELIARGADVQAVDLDNWSPLLFAAKGGYLEVIEILVEHGADIEHKDMGGWTSIMWASYRGHTSVVKYLVDHNADIHANGNYHLGPLLWAAGRGHVEIVQMLVHRGAKVNVGDKYGTTALVWACRKGHTEIVDILLKAGANVDTAGMYSWTPLLVAVSGGHSECVTLLLEKKPNVNALDKDGSTALSIACREGSQEISSALIAAGAYVNIQDRAGDTPLINAVKGGHRGVVEALLKRHADVDIQGKDKKTALYTAVEKGHVAIVKVLLTSNPDIEAATKDGDTPLLRAVRNRNLEIVQMLLEKRAKVGATDRKGDTCLHIAMRARSKAIVEALLRNPKNSQLLYRNNKAGETPYGLDALHQKTILGQVFGARKLNTNEDSEGRLGYELYSAALADVLSEPTLTTPITVGLYAKWGSGKSFLLAKLREEMQSFARQWAEPTVKAPLLILLFCMHFAVFVGIAVGLSTQNYIFGVVAGFFTIVLVYVINYVFRFLNRHYDSDWMYNLHHGVTKKIGKIRLILQVAFCHPPGTQSNVQAMPVRFHFAETNSTAVSGESAVGYMLASLFDAIENYYGSLPTRLYRAFRPKALKVSAGWRFRRMCCMPIVILFELGILAASMGFCLLILYYTSDDVDVKQNEEIAYTLYVLGVILLAGFIANLHAWAKLGKSLFFTQGRFLKNIVKNNEMGLASLGQEVLLMAEMVKCLDAFTGQQSRLVGVIDTLDSCDTERTLSVLNAIQTLLMTPNRPFVLLLAVDPHVVAKAAEANSKRLFTEGGIGGHDFLRNLVHLPVYLQNSGLRKVQRAQSTAMSYKRNIFPEHHYDEGSTMIGHSASARRLSNASEIMNSNEKLRAPSRPGSKKLRLSESIASSIGSNIHKLGTNQPVEFSKIMLTDDYFSDVNPRSMRRLMNVIYITVRLLKAFQIDFSWYRLSSWVNLTEQWPLRASMIVLEHDLSGESLEDSSSLQSLYDKVRPKLSCLREAATLLDLDRDERKLDAFLQLHKSDLQVADLRIFLPFTINLDPYLRKVLKEDQQALEDEGFIMPMKPVSTAPNINRFMPQSNFYPQHHPNYAQLYSTPNNPSMSLMNYYNNPMIPQLPQVEINSKKTNINYNVESPDQQQPLIQQQQQQQQQQIPIDLDLTQIRLSKLTSDELIGLLNKVNELKSTIDNLIPIMKDNAITGRVLTYCDLNELKSVLQLNFGHWEIFKLLILNLREIEKNSIANIQYRTDNVDGGDGIHQNQIHPPQLARKKSVVEKQVTLEEQMICGALQTLNEDAFEDVVGSERSPTDILTAPTPAQSSTSSSSPARTRRNTTSIVRHSGSIKSDKRVSIKADPKGKVELVNEKMSSKPPPKPTLARPASMSLLKPERPIFHMGNSFDENSEKEEDDEVFKPDNRSKKNKDENIPLVANK